MRWSNPVGIYLLRVNNRNTRTRYEICSKLTIKTARTTPGQVSHEHNHKSYLKVFYWEKNDIHSLRLQNTLFHDNQYWYPLMQGIEPLILPKFIHHIKPVEGGHFCPRLWKILTDNLRELNFLKENWYHHKCFTIHFLLEEKNEGINILIDDFIIYNGAPNSKNYFWLILRAIALQHLAFKKNGRPLFLLAELKNENRIKKSCFSRELWLFENGM